METEISKAIRAELVIAISDRYKLGNTKEKKRILDEFVALTGYHRKHAIRILNGEPSVGKRSKIDFRIYDEAVRTALVVLWEASDRICGKRLKPLLPSLVSALEKHGHLDLHADVRSKLMSASAATIDRLLASTRAAVRGDARRRKVQPKLRRSIIVRTFADWKDPLPGFMEIDLVAHCGESPFGNYLNTLVLTDIASGWTECLPLLFRDSALVIEALSNLRTAMPFPLRGIDSDNGSEFMNELMVNFCLENNIEFTRSRPYHKNDQAWIEQKNGSVVRRLVGYRRLAGLKSAQALFRLYNASRLFVNFFQPSFRLLTKTYNGARGTKRYDVPATPYSRLAVSKTIPDSLKEHLRAFADTLDPLSLLDEIRSAQHCLAALAEGETLHIPEHDSADLAHFLSSLATAWKGGEVRPTHCNHPRPTRHWRTRTDAFETVWPTAEKWLRAEPERTAIELLDRLQLDHPGTFSDGQLRTFQRRVKKWRTAMAKSLVFEGQGLCSADSSDRSRRTRVLLL